MAQQGDSSEREGAKRQEVGKKKRQKDKKKAVLAEARHFGTIQREGKTDSRKERKRRA